MRTPRILHLVATGQRRGGEMFASDLVGALDEAGVPQAVAVLASGEVAVPFGADVLVLGNGHRPLPGVRLSPALVRSVRATIRSRSPDVVLAHGGDPLKYAVAAGAGRHAALVYRRIGFTPAWMAGRLRRAGYGSLMRRADRLIAVAEAVKRDLVETFSVPPARIRTIPNAVDGARLRPRRSREETRRVLGIDPGAPVILVVAALTAEKDPLAHLRAARIASARTPGAHVLIAGDGPLRPRVEESVRDDGAPPRAALLGARDDVPDLLAAADLLLLASATEGMPATVIEAGLAGLPVAAYAVAGVPEVVVDGTTGVLVAPGDVEGLGEAAASLLADPERRRRMAEAARRRCAERFDIRAVAPAYLEVCERVARRVP